MDFLSCLSYHNLSWAGRADRPVRRQLGGSCQTRREHSRRGVATSCPLSPAWPGGAAKVTSNARKSVAWVFILVSVLVVVQCNKPHAPHYAHVLHSQPGLILQLALLISPMCILPYPTGLRTRLSNRKWLCTLYTVYNIVILTSSHGLSRPTR